MCQFPLQLMYGLLIFTLLFWTPVWCVKRWGGQGFVLYLQNKYGVHLSYWNVQLVTTAFNPLFIALGRPRPFIKVWFHVGLVLVGIGSFFAIGVLFVNFVLVLVTPGSPLPPVPTRSDLNLTARGPIAAAAPAPSGAPARALSEPLLMPLIPGLNMPLAYLGYLIVALVVSSVVHELGHAMAAVGEGLVVHRCGAILVYVLPGAFVQIDETINYSLPVRQLRVYTAGAWHNVVLCVACYLVLLAVPYCWRPWWSTCNTMHNASCTWVVSVALDHPLKDVIAAENASSPIAIESLNGHAIGSPPPPPPLVLPPGGAVGPSLGKHKKFCYGSLCCCVGDCVVRHCHLYPLYSWQDILLTFAEMELTAQPCLPLGRM